MDIVKFNTSIFVSISITLKWASPLIFISCMFFFFLLILLNYQLKFRFTDVYYTWFIRLDQESYINNSENALFEQLSNVPLVFLLSTQPKRVRVSVSILGEGLFGLETSHPPNEEGFSSFDLCFICNISLPPLLSFPSVQNLLHDACSVRFFVWLLHRSPFCFAKEVAFNGLFCLSEHSNSSVSNDVFLREFRICNSGYLTNYPRILVITFNPIFLDLHSIFD